MQPVIDIAGLPKVELHLHLEGTFEPELIFEIAERNGIVLPDSLDELRARYSFTDLQSFLDLYYANMAVLLHEQDFADLTRAYLARAQAAGVRHVEIFFDPQAHVERGVSLTTCVAGIAGVLARSSEDYGITSALIATFLRHLPEADAVDVLTELIAMKAPIIGIGLDSAEAGNPPSDFVALYALAHAHGLECVAHAGEEGPPEYVWQALRELSVTRIDHGIRSMEDPALVEHLVEHGVPLTVCPLSNVRLRVVDTMADHPLPAMLERGLAVNINSDDPAYFGGYIDDNYAAVATEFALTPAQLALLARNAVDASFGHHERKALIHAEIDTWLMAQAG
jgi:adenosine deaminase